MNSLEIRDLNISYGDKKVVRKVSMDIRRQKITSIIGPSGCGKTSFITSLNRMVEENKGQVEGEIVFEGKNLYDYDKDLVRKNIGMVFQTPRPFPFSIYKNLTYALAYYGIRDRKEMDRIVVDCLQRVGLYEEVKDDLSRPAGDLSGGQQQRLCIARALTVNPKVLVLDEPCSALDLKNTEIIERLLVDLSRDYTIVIVTHNLAQASRISDYTAFFLDGELLEYDRTDRIFSQPKSRLTQEYIGGIYG